MTFPPVLPPENVELNVVKVWVIISSDFETAMPYPEKRVPEQICSSSIFCVTASDEFPFIVLAIVSSRKHLVTLLPNRESGLDNSPSVTLIYSEEGNP